MIAESYWVRPGVLLAGPYPGERLESLRAAGITAFLDLTEPGEREPYGGLLGGWATHRRRAIPDFGCPSPAEMASTLDEIDAALERGDVLAVHCRGGAGRTGAVVGCWLVRHGLDPDEALASIADLRRGLPGSSPETDEQVEFVRAWAVGS